MVGIEAGAAHAPVIALPEPPRKADGASHLVKNPPAGTRDPSRAPTPTRPGDDAGVPSARIDVEGLAERLNREFAAGPDRLNRRIRFSVDPRTEELIVRVIDGDTERVIGQFPPDYVLKRIEALGALKGLLFQSEG